MREESQRWLDQSKEDFDAAEANLQIKKYYVCAFFCQQAAEKALKALAIETLREQPKTHSLIDLAKLVKPPAEIRIELEELNPDYTVSRYPDAANGVPAHVYNAKKASVKLAASKKVLEWVHGQFK